MNVSELKNLDFINLPLAKQLEVIEAGRPTPHMNIIQKSKSKNQECVRQFKCEMYDKNNWLCGCETSNRLYCFPCLLFNKKADKSWTQYGVNDLSHFSKKIRVHEGTHDHLNSLLELAIVRKGDVKEQLANEYRRNNKTHNEQVRKNRYILSKIINCVLFYGNFELDVNISEKNAESNDTNLFRAVINFAAGMDSALKDHFTVNDIFLENTDDTLNDLLDCLLKVCRHYIKKEISTANFLSIIVEESTDISKDFHLVIVLRYVLSNGLPVERFWGFLKPVRQDSASIAQSIIHILKEVVDNPDKLISQSYDGINIWKGHLSSTMAIIQHAYTKAHFVHCYAHQFNSIVAQCASKNQQVRIFFSNLSEIANFLNNSEECVATLDKIAGEENQIVNKIKQDYHSETISAVFENRELLIECMKNIESSCKLHSVINRASNIHRLLEDSSFVFWLSFFHSVMPHVDILFNQMQSNNEAFKVKNSLEKFQISIETENKRIDINIDEVEAKIGKKRKTDDINLSGEKGAIKHICDIIINQANKRFSFCAQCRMNVLFDVPKFQIYNIDFPTELIQEATNCFDFLDFKRLKIELKVIYSRSDFRTMTGAASMLRYIIHNELQKTLPQIYKLLLIVLTIPMITTEEERCFTTLKRIKTFLKHPRDEQRLNALAMLSIEKNMINQIPNFNECLIDEFASSKNRNVEYMYRT